MLNQPLAVQPLFATAVRHWYFMHYVRSLADRLARYRQSGHVYWKIKDHALHSAVVELSMRD